MNIEQTLLNFGNSYDDSICKLLMWQNDFGWEDSRAPIQDSGKSGDKRIYSTLKEIEKQLKIKL